MKVLGIDIGSKQTKLVILDERGIFYSQVSLIAEKSGIVGQKAIQQALSDTGLTSTDIDLIVATGHSNGGTSFADFYKRSSLCVFKGGVKLFPDARTIIDVGAENTTVISLDNKGRIKGFEINDKCASGGGMFLEVIAKALGMSYEEFALEALGSEKAVDITSTCTIFAEQAAISYAFEDPPPPRAEIVAGIHKSLALRVVGLARRVGFDSPVVLCGGVAMNRAFVRSFKKEAKAEIFIPENPLFVAALGAAVFGRNEIENRKGGK